MGNDHAPPHFLLDLAGAGIAPVIGGCVGVLAAGPLGGLMGAMLGNAAEKAVERFAGRIAAAWWAWFKGQPPSQQQQAVEQLAALTPEEARRQADAVVACVAPDASPEDRSLAASYLAAIPAAVQQSALIDRATGKLSCPPSALTSRPEGLLQLLPRRVPPYAVPCALPGSGYLLDRLLGMGGFGAVYLARLSSEPYSPGRALKFCLDPSLLPSLRRERDLLDRLQAAGRQPGSEHIVRLYGYDLDYPETPYLVYEYVPGGDLSTALALARGESARPDWPATALRWVEGVARGLGFAHGQGLVHRDLKPANVLVDGERLKLADFGIGGVSAAHALELSRLASADGGASSALKADLFRGSGTWVYMSPEQKRGDPPDPRQDVYSLGVLWYQLLLGQVSQEMHPGWEDDLKERGAPEGHRALIRRCVGGLKGRPAHGGELLSLLQGLRAGPPQRGRSPEVILDALPARRPSPPRPPSPPAPLPAGERKEDARPQAAKPSAEPTSRRPSLAGAMVAFLLVLLLVVLGFAGFVVWRTLRKGKTDVATTARAPGPPPAPREPDPPSVPGIVPVVSPLRTFGGHSDEVTALAFSPRGEWVASASKDQTVKVWDARTGEEHSSARIQGAFGEKDWVTSVAYSPDGSHLAAGCAVGIVRAIDPDTGKWLSPFGFLGSAVHRVAFSPDGKYLAAAGEGKGVKVWDARSGEEILSFAHPDGQIRALAFSSNGLHLATGSSQSDKVRTWLMPGGKEAGTLDAHPGGVSGVAWEGGRIVTGGGDGVARIWDHATRATLHTLEPHAGRVTDVAYRADGGRVVTAAAEGSVLVWDPRSGELLHACGGLPTPAAAVAFSPDGGLIAAVSGRTVVLWRDEG